MRDVLEFMDWVWETHEPMIREVVEDLATVGAAIAWCVCGAGLGDNDDGKEGHATVTVLIGLVLASTGTLVSAVQQTDLTRIGFVWFYLFATLIPLIAMNAMVRATAAKSDAEKPKRHFFDKPTVRIAQVALVACGVLWAFFWVSGFQNEITGQATAKFTTFTIDAVEDHQWEDGTIGLAIWSNVPDTLDRMLLAITEEELLRNGWNVAEIHLREGTTAAPGKIVSQHAILPFEADEFFTYERSFHSFRQPGTKYVVEVLLRQTTQFGEIDRSELKRATMDGKGISIVNSRSQ